VKDLENKEMPIDEKYDRLLDEYISDNAISFALFKELGVDTELGLEKSVALSVETDKKTLPAYLGIAFKVLKTITPGKAFNQVLNSYLYHGQTWHPMSALEVTKISDREAVVRIKNCVLLKRARDLVKKTGLDIDPKIFCERDAKYFPKLFKDFGIDIAWELEENGCRATAKLK
jgi:hypothetical protein